jgi:hypothetical protein
MKFSRKAQKSTLYLWVILLSVTLLCAQGVKLHVHSLDHDHDHHHGHANLSVTEENIHIENEHTHLSIAHLSTDDSHIDHHDEVISESDACPDCLLTKIAAKTPFMALLAILFTLVLSELFRYTLNRRVDEDEPVPSRRYHLTPVLRAPPR